MPGNQAVSSSWSFGGRTTAFEALSLTHSPLLTSYHSGRKAVSVSRRGDGSRGLYTMVFDDSEYQSMLGYFAPGGMACCYYRNGSIRMLTDREGGTLFDEV